MSFDTKTLSEDVALDTKSDIQSSIESAVEDLVSKYLEDHMEAQPYSIECSYCGANLSITRSRVDGDFDLHLQVEPCDCQKGD